MKKTNYMEKKLKNIEQNFLSFTNSRIFHYLLQYWGMGGYAGWDSQDFANYSLIL